MKHIKQVIKNGDKISLVVWCPHHNGTTVISEDQIDCMHCGNEIEQQNMDAWTEYDRLKPKHDFEI